MVGPVEDAKIGDDHVDDVPAGQRQRALRDELRVAALGIMLHHDDDLLDSGDEVHRPAHALHHLARDHPVGDVAFLGHLHRPQHGEVDMAAADHREALLGAEIGGAVQFADRLLAGVDQIGIDLILVREGPDPEHPVLALERDLHPLRDVVGDERRDSDPEIDVIPVAKLLGGAGGHLVAGPGHYEAPST
jgi:hypothetical protein